MASQYLTPLLSALSFFEQGLLKTVLPMDEVFIGHV